MPDQYREPPEGEQSSQEVPSTLAANPVEQEILELEKKLVEKRTEREKSIEAAIGLEQPTPSAPAAAPIPSVIIPQPAAVKAEVEKLSGIEKNQQLKSLVDLAFQKGVTYATEVARNLNNPYLLDEFHDTLIDEFHKKLVEEGKLEEI